MKTPYCSEPTLVLAIDDSELCLRVVGRHLQGDNLVVVGAPDGPSGLAVACERHPDLILLDLTLPGWDGYETLRRLKADPRTRSIPVIFLSAAGSSSEKARGLDLGAVDFVTKPFDAEELRARVRVALRTKQCHDLLEQRAHLDALTGLANRHSLDERLAADWALCCRLGKPISVVVADLDLFKKINDRLGHWAGDEVLRRTARALRDSVRAGDFAARFGGEEFVVIAPDCDLDGAHSLAERFRDEVERTPLRLSDESLRVTVSVGVSCALDPCLGDPNETLCRADWAMYQAKTEGRNTVRAWNPVSPADLALQPSP